MTSPPALIFTGLITPHDPVSGEVVVSSAQVENGVQAARYGSPMLDMPLDRPLAQAWTVFRNLAVQLDQQGVGFDRLVRLRIFLRDLRDLPAFEAAAERHLDGARPVLTVVEVPTAGVDPAIDVVVDAVAVGKAEPVPEPLLSSFAAGPHAIRTGELIFVGATVGRDAAGNFPRRLAELSDAPDELNDGPRLSSDEEEVAAQSWLIFRQISELIGAQGGSLADVVKLSGWLTFPMREYRPLAEVRHYHGVEHKLRPASGAVQVQAVQPKEARLAFEAVAVTSGSARQSGSTSQMSEIYTDAETGGGYIWTSGEVPVDPQAHHVVTGVEGLEDKDRHLAAGNLHSPSRAEIQAHAVYDRLFGHLAQHAPSEQIVHQTVFIRRPEHYPGVERAALARLGSELPPTTVVPVCDASPSREADVEIELVARSNEGAQQ